MQRKRLWSCLSALWLDTEMSDYDVAEISDALRDSGLSRDELTLTYRLDSTSRVCEFAVRGLRVGLL